jgi:hypothetical protein
VFSILAATAVVRTVIAVVRHAATGDYRGVAADILGSTAVGKAFGLAARPMRWVVSAFDKGSTMHKAVVLVGRVGGPVASRVGHGVWGTLRSAVKPT